MTTAKEIMTRNVITVKKTMPIKDLSKLFVETKVNGVPVVDEKNKVIGIVTQSDLVEQNKNLHIPTVIALFDAVLFIESEKKFESEVKKLAGTTVEDIYHSKVISVNPDTEIGEIASLMADKHVHTLPVIDGGTLLGVIGKIDVIRGMS